MQGSHKQAWNEPLTLGEVLRAIIQGEWFRARVHSDLSGIKLRRFIQSIETDIEILTQLAEAYSAILKSDGETVAILKGSGEPELRLKPIHQTKEAAKMAAQKELDKVKKIPRFS